MKTLLIMRHAKSDYPPDVRSDFDRPLNEQGRKDVPLVGKLLKNFGPRPNAVSASPALRARQTVEGLATTLNLPTNALSFHESLYLALPQTLAQAAATFPNSVQTGLLIAHNPGLEEWVAQLTGARVELLRPAAMGDGDGARVPSHAGSGASQFDSLKTGFPCASSWASTIPG